MARSCLTSSWLVVAALAGCGFPSYKFGPDGEVDAGAMEVPTQDTSVPLDDTSMIPDVPIATSDVLAEVNETAPVALCTDNEKNGLESDVDCGGDTMCSRCALDQRCSSAQDCASKSCVGGRCSQPTCADSSVNGTETDIDCGGACPLRCADEKHCLAGTDCQSKSCVEGVCKAPTCTDLVPNGGETDADCGGIACPKCSVGKACVADGDCIEGLCRNGTTAGTRVCVSAKCINGLKDPSESDVDCGGRDCDKCSDGKLCLASSDCVSGVCGLTGRCSVPACNDHVANGTETDLDCGGGCATGVAPIRCDDLLGCKEAKDCQSGVCTGDKCQRPSCTDNVKNGNETDKDCGGSCPACVDTLGCAVGRDCKSGVCDPTAKTCSVPTCLDEIKNGQETDLDCGGELCRATHACDDGKACSVPGDCKNGRCTNRLCLAAECNDGIKNGSETDQDCGGPVCADCPPGKACLVGTDCTSGVCSGTPLLCQPPACPDGVQNQGETDLDCGGPSCALKCGLGRMCNVTSDCAPGYICPLGPASPNKVCTSEFQVVYQPIATPESPKLIALRLILVNNGTRNMLVSRFKFVYWYTRDGYASSSQIWARCSTGMFNNGFCTFTFADYTPVTATANAAMTLSLSKSLDSDSAHSMVMGGRTWGPLPLSFDSIFVVNQEDDYSHSPTAPTSAWPRIGLYLDDTLVWGEPPQ